MSRPSLLALVAVSLWATTARAEPTTLLRMASPAPEGTAWAREARAFARDVEALTHGSLKIKYYLGGITGDELQTAERIRRGQLDGIASGGMLCMKLAPSMRVMRIVGLFQSREESSYVSGRLRAVFDEEFKQSGFANLGEIGIGPDVLFSSAPVRSFADLKQTKWWVWDLDEVLRLELPAMGMQAVPVPLEQAARAFEEGRLDGYVAVPSAALAFQWSAQSRYTSDLRIGFLRGCLLVSNRAYDQLPLETQLALRTANAKLLVRLEDTGRAQDDALLGGLFDKQGVKQVQVSNGFRSEFYEAARNARDKLGADLVPPALLQRVMAMLADYRAEHRNEDGAR